MKSERSGTRQVVLIRVTKEVAVVQASGGVTVWDQPGAWQLEAAMVQTGGLGPQGHGNNFGFYSGTGAGGT